MSRDSLPGQVAPAAGLETNDDDRDLQVPLLLQVGQHAGPEEDLALPDAVQIAVELQGFDLEEESRLLSTGHPSHHRALEQGQGQGRGLELGQALLLVGSLLLVQGKWSWGNAGTGKVGASKGQVRSQTCRETQDLSPEGTL